MRSNYLSGLLAAGLLLSSVLASAAPITVENAFYFRENRGVNDVGQGAGDRLVFGATSVVPNGDNGTTATRRFGGGAIQPLPFNPSTVNPNQFSNSIAYNTGAANAQLNLTFTNGLDTTLASVSAVGGIGLMPLAFDLGVSGTGTALTLNWTDPVIPTGLALERAQNAFAIRLEDLRDGVDPTLGGPARLSSSQTYFSFMTSAPVSEPGIHALMAVESVTTGLSVRPPSAV
jgi:hypothetical protein